MVSLQYYHSVLYSSSARKLSLEGFLQLFQFFLLVQAAYCREELFESCPYNAYLDFLRFLVYFYADAKAFRQAARVADFLNHYFPIPPLVLFSLRVFSFALCFSEINVMHLAICFFKFPIVAGFSGLVPALWLLFSFASFAFASFSFSSSSLVPKDLNCEIVFFFIFLGFFLCCFFLARCFFCFCFLAFFLLFFNCFFFKRFFRLRAYYASDVNLVRKYCIRPYDPYLDSNRSVFWIACCLCVINQLYLVSCLFHVSCRNPLLSLSLPFSSKR